MALDKYKRIGKTFVSRPWIWTLNLSSCIYGYCWIAPTMIVTITKSLRLNSSFTVLNTTQSFWMKNMARYGHSILLCQDCLRRQVSLLHGANALKKMSDFHSTLVLTMMFTRLGSFDLMITLSKQHFWAYCILYITSLFSIERGFF